MKTIIFISVGWHSSAKEERLEKRESCRKIKVLKKSLNQLRRLKFTWKKNYWRNAIGHCPVLMTWAITIHTVRGISMRIGTQFIYTHVVTPQFSRREDPKSQILLFLSTWQCGICFPTLWLKYKVLLWRFYAPHFSKMQIFYSHFIWHIHEKQEKSSSNNIFEMFKLSHHDHTLISPLLP